VNEYEIEALAIVLSVPFIGVLLVSLAVGWAIDSVRRSAAVGGIGVLCTLVGVGYLFRETACELTVNRPAIMALLGPGDCRRTGLVAVQLVLLLALGTALAVRAPDLRR
jgi:hypothetical protein